MPAGRSVNRPSPLSSRPVVTLYGEPDEARTFRPSVMFLMGCMLNDPPTRCGTSPMPGPHSVARLSPLAGIANAPVVSVRFRLHV